MKDHAYWKAVRAQLKIAADEHPITSARRMELTDALIFCTMLTYPEQWNDASERLFRTMQRARLNAVARNGKRA